jgi:putative transposase
MTYGCKCSLPSDILEPTGEQELAVLPDLIHTLVNAAMALERQHYLGAGPYERTEGRRGHANGYKPKTVATRLEKLTFQVPQVREGDFYPNALEKGLRSERALKLALAEMYVQGVSTQRVAAITEELCGFDVSSTQVSQAAAALDEQLAARREREMGWSPYLWLDAHYEKVRQDGQVRDAAVLRAVDLNNEGKRDSRGVGRAVETRGALAYLLAAAGTAWLHGVELIVSDAHAGLLQAARRTDFGGVPWQRCQFHLQQNAQAYVPRQALKREVAADIRSIFAAADRAAAE